MAKIRPPQPGYVYALLAALLFGASTPAAKWLLRDMSPWLLAGLLYLGSGVGLFVTRQCVRWVSGTPAAGALRGSDWLWLAGATTFGGVLGPALLMAGLARSDTAAASLLLNLEGVFTALLAWFVFKEAFDRRIVAGMGAILAGSLLLSWSGAPGALVALGPLAVAAACLCWGVDNNLTKKIAASDALQIAMVKGFAAGATNTVLALVFTDSAVAPRALATAGIVGFLGYGISLLCFVLALRSIGAARTGAYFSLAPFVGVLIALGFSQDSPSWRLVGACALMAFGVWLHLTERHEHEHVHDAGVHEHLHVHDAHHRHAHGPADPAGEPHSHRHRHERLVHTHRHFPDALHTHVHD